MIRFIYLSCILFTSLLIAQNSLHSNQDLNEIDNYVRSIDSSSNISQEGLAEGPIIYNSIFRKNRGWEAYYLNDNSNDKSPLRIRYSATGTNENEDLNLYYRNGKLVYAELKVTFTSGKRKKMTPFTKRFYFPNGKLVWESKPEQRQYIEVDKIYNMEYLLQAESLIRKMVYQ